MLSWKYAVYDLLENVFHFDTKYFIYICLGGENTATRGAFEKTAGRGLAGGMYHRSGEFNQTGVKTCFLNVNVTDFYIFTLTMLSSAKESSW